mgnify:CR=1 FL=1
MNRINLICLGVRDMAKSLAFYKAVGFQTYEKADCPPLVFFDSQGSKRELFPLGELAKDINAEHPPKLSSDGFSGITLACNMKSESQVDACMALVEESGGAIVKKPEMVSWGGYSGYFRDTEGYYWEVAYGPGWRFDDNGMLVIDEGGEN